MEILVVGASGATGSLLVKQLLESGESVKAVIRPNSSISGSIINHENLTVVRASVLDLRDDEIAQLTVGCKAIASCLGHNLTFKGIYGHPQRLVTDSIRRLCKAVRDNHPDMPVKVVLMNTTGNSNRDIPERISLAQSCVIWLLRLLLPPHVDNEKAADFLRTEVGSTDQQIEWAVVRPDTLTNENEVTDYEAYPSPIRSAIFDPGTTSRINVGHFMVRLITDKNTWSEWKGKMPVIYNAD
ncbi:NAD(P)-binding oxidoreductase [Acaryochloris sp. IP29b_bin.148]|uniref:NAD(P)-dependent oxidoreductase n=1 Tax=Acaryochloris sp. IP29b_bin.148 TaxID=2969218 RepID=UPI0026298849|nr:NAD(P)-binding oxidoreductase [Acaryochloris sp. IP29b_bin.148]